MFKFEREDFDGFLDGIFPTEVKEKPTYYSKNIDGKIKMAIPMPGFEKENIKIYFENGLMIVEANAKPWYVNLDYKSKFQFVDCDENSIEAEYKNGVLELYINKKISNKTVNIK